MKSMMWSVALLVAVVLPAVVGAQSGSMAKGDKMDKMEMKDATHTGRIAAGTTAGTFLLTHVADDEEGRNGPRRDGRDDHDKRDAMGKDTRAKDAMAKDEPAFTVKSLKMIAASCS